MEAHERRTLPEGWEWEKMGNVAEYINGRAFKPTEWDESGKPIIRIQNLTDESNSFNYFNGECEQKHCIKNGDILISWSASLGVFVWNRNDAVLNQHIFKAIPSETIIDRNFFVFVARTVIEEMGRKTHGSTMKHIVKSEFNNIKIPLPPLPIQRRIVSILEKAEETKKLRAQADELMDRLLQSVFLEMFGDPVRNPKGWDIVTLNNVCDKITDGTHQRPTYIEKGVPFLSVKDITKGYLDLSDLKYISLEEHKKLIRRCKPEEGDILYTKVGVNYGIAELVSINTEFSIYTEDG
jgi:type I restriction enzyme S subunit